MENLIEIDPALNEKILVESAVAEYIFKEIRNPEFDSNILLVSLLRDSVFVCLSVCLINAVSARYASEILSVLLQNSSEKAKAHMVEKKTVGNICAALERFQEKDPRMVLLVCLWFWGESLTGRLSDTEDEREFLENLFDSLCSLVHAFGPAKVGTHAFVPCTRKSRPSFVLTQEAFAVEGAVGLFIILIKNKRKCLVGALKVLDFALVGKCPWLELS